jgi:hypothetical protein
MQKEMNFNMGRIIDKSSPSYGKVVTILRKQAGRYLIEFEKGGRSYWFTSDKIEII